MQHGIPIAQDAGERTRCGAGRKTGELEQGESIVAAGAAPCVQFATLPQHSDGGHFRLRDNLTLIQHCGVGRRVSRTSGGKRAWGLGYGRLESQPC
jgi:hypothetical protein